MKEGNNMKKGWKEGERSEGEGRGKCEGRMEGKNVKGGWKEGDGRKECEKRTE